MFDDNGARVTADHFSQLILEPVFFQGQANSRIQTSRII
jgi:hypothetical protein